LAARCDVFVANCWDLQDRMKANGEAPGQTGTRDAATMAEECGARVLVLTRMGKRLAALEGRRRGLDEIGRLYQGRVVFGRESMRVAL
jgi:hypothetical protein